MAKDGTLRGGARKGSGAKVKEGTNQKYAKPSLKLYGIENGPPKVEFTEEDSKGMKEYLNATQWDGSELETKEIYGNLYAWLKSINCSEVVNQELLEQYSMSVARNIQAEKKISELGMLGTHPTTGAEIVSPYVNIAQSYLKQANQLWVQIASLVKEKMAAGQAAPEDPMEALLKKRSG